MSLTQAAAPVLVTSEAEAAAQVKAKGSGANRGPAAAR